MNSYDRCFPFFENACYRLQEIDFDQLTQPEKDVVCVFTMIAETNNGGLHQFYINSSGDLALETADAFERIGASRIAEIMRQTNTVFGRNGPPRNRSARCAEIFSLPIELQDEKLGPLTQAFFNCEDDCYDLLYSYILAHRNEFFEPAEKKPWRARHWDLEWPKPKFVSFWDDG